MRGIHCKGMRGKSNVIKRNVEKVWDARYTLGARYLPKNKVHFLDLLHNLRLFHHKIWRIS
jgi:hypothetical protein